MTMIHRGKIISNAEFKRLWDDLSLSKAQIGDILGISGRAVTCRAQMRGLPPRKGGGHLRAKATLEDILALWNAGVTTEDIGRHFGVSAQTIRQRMARNGITRTPLRAGQGLPLADYLALQLSARMAESAAVTKAAMRDAEMVEQRPGRPRRAA